MLLAIVIGLFLGQAIGPENKVHTVELEVFQDSKAKELIYRSSVSEECKPLPLLSWDVFFQSSNCTMIYHSSDCKSFSHKLVPGSLIQFSEWMHMVPAGYVQKSYKLCSETEQGNTVTVTLYGENKLRPVAEYTDVCDCVNVPTSIGYFGVDSMINHGNCLLLYDMSGCDGFSIRVEGGKNFISDNLLLYITLGSFEPCNAPRHCFSFFASAILYELQLSIQEHHLKKFSLSALEKFYNNGTGQLERTYNITESLDELFQFTKSSTFSKLSSVTVDASLNGEVRPEVTGSLGLSKLASVESAVKTSLPAVMSEALSGSEIFTNTNDGATVLIDNLKEYVRSERIIVPAFTEVEVSSYVNMIKNVPVSYVVYFRVTGKQGRKVLSSAQIRKHFITEDMAYITSKDGTNAVYQWNGTLTATLGLQATVAVHERKIYSCNNHTTANVTQTIIFDGTVDSTHNVQTSRHPTTQCDPYADIKCFFQTYGGIMIPVLIIVMGCICNCCLFVRHHCFK